MRDRDGAARASAPTAAGATDRPEAGASRPASAEGPAPGISAGLTFLLAAACGLIVANLYFSQPLIGLIAPEIGLPVWGASLIVTLTQAGYCVGLILLVPLGDMLENRALVLWTLVGVVGALIVTSLAQGATELLAAGFALGVCSVAVQMLVPMAAHLAPDASRGRVVGNVMSGLLVGIMLSRPVASLTASAFGWRALFGGSAVVMVLLGGVLARALPRRQPASGQRYGELIASLWTLLRDTPLLRRRAAYQAALFAAFSLYWTAVPLLLAGPMFGLSQRGIALFALAGAAGALAAPVAGRWADRGLTRLGTGVALASVALAFVLAWLGVRRDGSIALLLAAGVLLDMGVQANLVLGQRAIYSLGAAFRSRLNGVFMSLFFAGGAAGSAIAGIAFAHGGWAAVSAVGLAFAAAALAFFATEFGQPAPAGAG